MTELAAPPLIIPERPALIRPAGELWVPSKPFVIRSRKESTLPGMAPLAAAASGAIPFSYEFIGAPEVAFTTTTLSTTLNIGSTPVAGRLIVVAAGVNRSGAPTVTGVTFNGVAGSFVQVTGTNTTTWIAWGVVATGTTCSFTTTVNAAPVRTAYCATYVLYSANDTPAVTPTGVGGGSGASRTLTFTNTEDTVMIAVSRTDTTAFTGDLIEDYALTSSGSDQQDGASLQAGAGTHTSTSVSRTLIGRGWVAA